MKIWRFEILITALFLWAASQAQAQTATFDFDSGTPTLPPGQNVPFDQTVAGMTAHFSSPSGAAFSVQSNASTGWTLSQFSGKYLFDNNQVRNLLDIKFSQPLTGITLSFATADFHQVETPTSIQLTAYMDSTSGVAVGTATAHGTYGTDTMPMGTLSFNSGNRPFNLVEITILFQPSGATAYFIDNIAITPGPIGGGPTSKLGVYRSVGPLGQWALDVNDNGAFDSADVFKSFGLQGDQAVAGDWDGTGVVRMGVFRAGAWYLDLNNNGRWDGVAGGDGLFSFGLPGDIAVVGDWTGNGVSRFGVFRCQAGQICTWVLDVNGSKAWEPSDPVYSYGLFGDVPVVNNWNGVGKEDQIGVYRPMPNGLGLWIVDSNGSGAWEPSDAIYQFGLATDLPVVGNWNNSPHVQPFLIILGLRKRIGVFRNGIWILDSNGNNAYDLSDAVESFGVSGDQPVVGNWSISGNPFAPV